MNKKVIIITVIFFSISNKIICQENKKWEDSLAISFLQDNEFGDKTGTIKNTIKGKIVESKNYYCYESFKAKTSPMSSIYLVNFGTFTTETPIYVAIVEESNNEKKIFILGEKKFEEELEQLNNFFKSKESLVEEEYKIEIVNLFLRCRQGQRKTPTYLH